MRPAPCVVSVAEHTGWAHLVCVAAPGNVPAVIARRRVALIDQGLPTLPYEHETAALAAPARGRLRIQTPWPPWVGAGGAPPLAPKGGHPGGGPQRSPHQTYGAQPPPKRSNISDG